MSESIKIGFADAVREAVSRGSDDWLFNGWRVIRKTEKFNPRSDRARAMHMAADHLTPDYREYIHMRIQRERIEKTVAETARILRMKQRSGVAE
ncbi:MAG: hypothetical protein IE917_10745 [Betaproteobacteria bacterium]|nr:hypothetical protein [Betaproteobacteria bacterium]